ncbi:MAG: hypothetical protein ACE5E1_11165 [Phycisphaerae bacterium]
MRLPSRLCRSLLLATALCLPAQADREARGAEGWRPPAGGTRRTNRRRANKPKPFIPEIDLYPLGPAEQRRLETNEMIAIALGLYQPDPSEAESVKSEIRRFQGDWWESAETSSEYVDLINQRANICRKLSAASKPDEKPGHKLRRMRRDRELSTILARIRLFERKHPHRLGDRLDRIEALISPDKVEAARREWRARLREVRGRAKIRTLLRGLSARRLARRRASNTGGAASTGRAKPNGRRRSSPPAGGEASPPKRKGATKRTGSASGGSRKSAKARPLDQWEQYVRDFIRAHELTPTQTNSALSILKDQSARAAWIANSNRDRIAAAKKLKDAKLRKQRLAELHKPIDDLFMELQRRLEGLLTAAQRKRSGGS